MWLDREQMPENGEDLAKIPISFPGLQPDTESSCPLALDAIHEYLRVEWADGQPVPMPHLRFLRTAQVAEDMYWIWEFSEADGTRCYVTVSLSPTREACISYDEVWCGITPEQYMLHIYHAFH